MAYDVICPNFYARHLEKKLGWSACCAEVSFVCDIIKSRFLIKHRLLYIVDVIKSC